MARKTIEIPGYSVVAGVCGQCGVKKTYHQSVRPDQASREDSNRADMLSHMQAIHPRNRSAHEFFIQVVGNRNLDEIFADESLPMYYHPSCGQLIDSLRTVVDHICEHRRNGTAMWEALVTANETARNAKALAAK